jgi:FAD:protein FMN transferase
MKTNAFRVLSLALALLGSIAAAVSAEDLPVVRWQGRTMGSPYTVQIVGTNLTPPQVEALQAEIEARLKEVNRQMSHYQPDSELSQFNRAPANRPFKVSAEFARVVRFSLEMARRSGGAFDPTLAPVINLWGFGEKTEQHAVPAEAELKAALAKTGWQHLTVTDRDELLKDLPDLTVNLSAVAKGFGADEMVRVLQHHGLTNVYAAIAGEVAVRGHNARGTNWQVGISAPVAYWNENDPVAAVVSLSNQAVSTSGDYQKFFTDPQGRRLSHIMDPRTGWPVQHHVGGVSVVAPDSMTADALSTALFVLGSEAGLKFIETWTNAAALFIVREAEGQYRPISSSQFEAQTGYRTPKEMLSIPPVPR